MLRHLEEARLQAEQEQREKEERERLEREEKERLAQQVLQHIILFKVAHYTSSLNVRIKFTTSSRRT